MRVLAIALVAAALLPAAAALQAPVQPPVVVAVGMASNSAGCTGPIRFQFDATTGSGLASREASCGVIFAENLFTGGGCLEFCTGFCVEHSNTTVECWRFGPEEGDRQPYARLSPDGAFFLRDVGGDVIAGRLVRTP